MASMGDSLPEDIRAEKKNITLYTGRTYTTPRVLMALEECGVEYDIVYVDLPAGDQRHPGFKELSFSGQVPVLVDTTTHPPLKLTESNSILFYLSSHYHASLLPPPGTPSYYTLHSLLDFITDLHLMIGLCKFIFSPVLNPNFGLNPSIDPHLASRTLLRANALNERLVSEGREYGTREPWLVGGRFGVADVSAWAMFRHLKDEVPYFAKDLEGMEEVGRWMARVEGRESCRKALELFEKFCVGGGLRREFEVKEGE